MAKQTIHSTSYQIAMDTREFEKGSVASRKEINLMKKAASEVLTPLERYEKEQAELGRLLEKDSRFQDTYNKKLAQAKKKFEAAEKAADKYGDELEETSSESGGFISSITDVASALDLAVKGFDLVSAGVNKIGDLSGEINELKKFGVEAEHFGTFKVLAADARVEVEDLADMAKNLSVRLAEAGRDPEGGVAKTFELIGINAEKVAKLDPVAQIEAFSKAVQGIPDHSKRLQIVDELVSDSGTKILDSILNKADAIENAANKAEKLGLNITPEDEARIEKAAQASIDMQLAWDAFTQNVIVELAPAITKLLGITSEVLDFVSGNTFAREENARTERIASANRLDLMQRALTSVSSGTETAQEASARLAAQGIQFDASRIEAAIDRQTEALKQKQDESDQRRENAAGQIAPALIGN